MMCLASSVHYLILKFTLNYFVVDKMVKGKRNTAHCLRFQDDWYGIIGDVFFSTTPWVSFICSGPVRE